MNVLKNISVQQREGDTQQLVEAGFSLGGGWPSASFQLRGSFHVVTLWQTEGLQVRTVLAQKGSFAATHPCYRAGEGSSLTYPITIFGKKQALCF